MYFVGIDIGSAASKTVAVDRRGEILAHAVVELGTGTTGANDAMAALEARLPPEAGERGYLLATGYGRQKFAAADSQKSELSCHAKGVHQLFPTVRTIADIGGQDSKAIRINQDGHMEQFVMNDKCAAGTGRFLEMMARVLNIPLGEFGVLDSRSTRPLPISSTCSVFAESEVISRLSEGCVPEDIVAGIHQSVASKMGTLLRNVGLVPDVALTGGVARNAGVVRGLERQLSCRLLVPDHPQLTGAYGAALYALEEWQRKDRNP